MKGVSSILLLSLLLFGTRGNASEFKVDGEVTYFTYRNGLVKRQLTNLFVAFISSNKFEVQFGDERISKRPKRVVFDGSNTYSMVFLTKGSPGAAAAVGTVHRDESPPEDEVAIKLLLFTYFVNSKSIKERESWFQSLFPPFILGTTNVHAKSAGSNSISLFNSKSGQRSLDLNIIERTLVEHDYQPTKVECVRYSSAKSDVIFEKYIITGNISSNTQTIFAPPNVEGRLQVTDFRFRKTTNVEPITYIASDGQWRSQTDSFLIKKALTHERAALLNPTAVPPSVFKKYIAILLFALAMGFLLLFLLKPQKK